MAANRIVKGAYARESDAEITQGGGSLGVHISVALQTDRIRLLMADGGPVEDATI